MEESEIVKEFLCHLCQLRVKYDYFGTKPPFAKSFTLLEDTYVMKDPFSSEMGMISLGSHCSSCQKSVCASGDCSIFYTKRFCLPCVQNKIEEFPVEIQQELKNKALYQKSRWPWRNTFSFLFLQSGCVHKLRMVYDFYQLKITEKAVQCCKNTGTAYDTSLVVKVADLELCIRIWQWLLKLSTSGSSKQNKWTAAVFIVSDTDSNLNLKLVCLHFKWAHTEL